MFSLFSFLLTAYLNNHTEEHFCSEGLFMDSLELLFQ